MALWCTLTLRWTALWSLGAKALWALPLAMAWGRWSISVMLKLLPSISQGLAKDVHKGLNWWPFALSSLLLAAANLAAWRWGTLNLLRPAAASVSVALLWVLYLRHRLGGHSGDLLGAGNQLVEAAALLALLVK
jgi:adenosylcobinamide-GDP ribazoletransferase